MLVVRSPVYEHFDNWYATSFRSWWSGSIVERLRSFDDVASFIERPRFGDVAFAIWRHSDTWVSIVCGFDDITGIAML